jgi:hypothetical protein
MEAYIYIQYVATGLPSHRLHSHGYADAFTKDYIYIATRLPSQKTTYTFVATRLPSKLITNT